MAIVKSYANFIFNIYIEVTVLMIFFPFFFPFRLVFLAKYCVISMQFTMVDAW